VAAWLGGDPAADSTGTGGTATNDGALPNHAAGLANGILTTFNLNCQEQCLK
jgi:hypothetical protein